MATPKRSTNSLAHLERLAFEHGADAAISHIHQSLGPEGLVRDYSVVEHGVNVHRLDTSANDQIAYQSFDPPSSWNLPYSVQLVRFAVRKKHDFMFHEGEELLIPLQGDIQYHFFWASPEDHRAPREVMLEHPVRFNEMLRINPMVPHHTWAVGEEALAWMIFHHASGTSDALIVKGAANSKPRRRVTAKTLRQPGRYALNAWGLSPMIRAARLRSQLSVGELADYIGTSASSLSRVEEGRANASLNLILKICRTLNLSFTDSIRAAQWAYEIQSFPVSGEDSPVPLLTEPRFFHHKLHPYYVVLSESRPIQLHTTDSFPNSFGSWIVLEGQLLLDLSEIGGRSVSLDPGSVAHFRTSAPVKVNALKYTRLLQIFYSPQCRCIKSERS